MKNFRLFLVLGLAVVAMGQSLVVPKKEARRISVLFFGAPTSNGPAHDPITRYRVLKKHLGVRGIDFTYSEDPAEALNAETLGKHDALLMYGNWEQNGRMPEAQEKALLDYVEGGGAFLPIHCASACYGASPSFVKLVGARFRSHGDGVFAPETTRVKHPVTDGYRSFKAWDETYVHSDHTEDRIVLQTRDGEPWTWVREQGKGKVFYTASGHDHRVWDTPEYHELLWRGIMWSVGKATRAKLRELALPELKFAKAQLPGYLERKTIEEYQLPLPPEESLKLAQVPPGFELSLFASEPDIVNPIAIRFDERGRSFVLETIDYPNNLQQGDLGHDRLTICEDTDGDHRADRFTRFAEKLSIPTSLVFAYDGVIITNGSEILYLRDTDGDDRADVRKPLFRGFNMGDTHAGPSNLRLAPDGWIYATIGYSGFRGQVGGQETSFTQGIFRFRLNGDPTTTDPGSDGTLQELVQLEYIQPTTNNTWGLDFTEEFDIFASTANGNPSAYVTFPRSEYERFQIEQPRTPRADFRDPFNPSSADIRQVENHNTYTSAASHAIYKGTRFPEEYRNKIAFVCGPTGKLVGQFRLEPEGSGFRSYQLPNNIYNSADAWSAPVCAEVGPDGALWVCDWYNIIVQHNPTPSVRSAGYDARTGKGNAYVTPLRDKQHGRIYRIYPKGSTDQKAKPAVAGIFEKMTRAGIDDIRASLLSDDRVVRRAALRVAPLDDTLEKTFIKDGSFTEKDPRTLVELLLALSRVAPSESVARALLALKIARSDAGLSDARQVAIRAHAAEVIPLLVRKAKEGKVPEQVDRNLFPDPGLTEVKGWEPRIYGGDRQKVEHGISKDGGRDGSPCLVIKASEPVDTGWAFTLRVKPNTRYEFGGYVRTENLKVQTGPGVLFNIHRGTRTKAVNDDQGWTRLSTTFTTERGQTEDLFHCLFGGYGRATGTAYFDDLFFRELGPASGGDDPEELARWFGANAPLAQVDMAKAALAGIGNPQSKQILAILAEVPRRTEGSRQFTIDAKVHQRGSEVYAQTCIACHGPDGKGVEGAFPPLVGSDWVTEGKELPIQIVLHGLMGPVEVGGKKFNNVMPPLGPTLNDQQIADVLTYVRQSWSNDTSPVSAAEVAKVRKETADRTSMYQAADLHR